MPEYLISVIRLPRRYQSALRILSKDPSHLYPCSTGLPASRTLTNNSCKEGRASNEEVDEMLGPPLRPMSKLGNKFVRGEVRTSFTACER
jgi:hypothetical protein